MWTYIIHLVRDLSPGVKRFIATESLFGIGAGIFSLILNLHLLDLGYSKAFIGQLTSLGALTVGLTSLPAGLIVKRVGRKPMLVTGMLLAFASLILFGIGTTAASLTAAQLIWSLGIAAVVNSEIQLIFQYCRSKKEETSAYSLLFAVFTFFTGVGTWLAGYLPDWMPGHTTMYQYAFFVAGGCLALSGLLRGVLLPSVHMREELAAAEDDGTNAPAEAGSPPEKSKKRPAIGFLLLLSLLIFSSGFTFGLLSPFLNVILKFRFGMADGSISGLLALSGFFFFIGSIAMPYIVERWGSRRTFVVLFLYNALVVALMAVAMPVAAFAVLLLLRGTGFTMLNNLTDSECMSAVNEEDRNLFAGMRTVSRSIGNTVASYWAGYILAGNHYSLPFVLTAAAVIAGYAVYAWFVQGKLDRRLQSQS
ncbi:MFS transporter [Paenibacillus sacheonensis]|uniref:MFS transporter n=1 Tax=Paenibacillus sacheonensis TaxID=742054 RepID=A0A7X4YN08_9BACL|nr:MFS transporter [Paenibacillus sacheonensis]MBM7564773.1 putative MFS family arabinose efflux permease [Paenibacillus sacheonensis]NBC69325.1 MFS transporter [Paenibacillus sacheonensis]